MRGLHTQYTHTQYQRELKPYSPFHMDHHKSVVVYIQLYSKYSDNKYRGHSASVLFLGQKIWNAPVHVIWHLDDTLLLVLHLNSGKCWAPQ